MKHIYDTDAVYLEALAAYIADQSSKAIEDHDYFTIAFSGGSAATKVCACLEKKEVAHQICFSKWKIFFSDERYVSLEDIDSNFKAIHDGLILKQKDIKRENVFALSKENNLEESCSNYEKKLRSVFTNCEFPAFDLIILGMGPDGHICSLFPNHQLLNESVKWIASLSDSPKPPPERITFTLSVVNAAKQVVFITTGEGKALKVKEAIELEPSKLVPASLVNVKNGELHWFLDNGSSSLLK